MSRVDARDHHATRATDVAKTAADTSGPPSSPKLRNTLTATNTPTVAAKQRGAFTSDSPARVSTWVTPAGSSGVVGTFVRTDHGWRCRCPASGRLCTWVPRPER